MSQWCSGKQDWVRYPDVANIICFSMFDIANLLLKKNKRLILFSWFGLLVVGGCLMAAWGRKPYLGPAEISSVVYTWLNSRMWDSG